MDALVPASDLKTATESLGTHLIIDVHGAKGLDDIGRIKGALLQAIDAAGATLLDIHLHRFNPQGITGVALLAESHITLHTWPELGYGAFDTFMCGDADPMAVVEVFKNAFEANDITVRTLRRGDRAQQQ